MYLKGTSIYVCNLGEQNDTLTRFVDSNFTRDLDKYKSLIGYIFSISGCVFSWKAFLLPIIILSTIGSIHGIYRGIKRNYMVTRFIL